MKAELTNGKYSFSRNLRAEILVWLVGGISYDRVPAVVHVVRAVLAGGAACANCISIRMAVAAAISHCGDCGSRRVGAGGGRDNAAIPIVERAFSDCGV